MNNEKKFKLIARLPTEEIITATELKELLEKKKHPVAYDGFEPSGMAHLAAGPMRAMKINDMIKAGVKFKLFVADWHGWINHKMDGDMEKIREVGNYLIKVWECFGLDKKKIEVVWASEHVSKPEYWQKVIEIAKNTTSARMARCTQIMGRKEGEITDTAQYFYPAMQAADCFELGCDITQLGMDQRRVYMLAREVGPKIGLWKPVVVSHHMLMGLTGPAKMDMDMKMSKSKPNSAIFVHDSEKDIQKKMNGAYCKEKDTAENPVLELCQYLLFRGEEFEFSVERPEKYGGNVTFTTYEELEKAFAAGKLHPSDLKATVAREVNEIVKPCREYFEKHPKYMEVFR